jgi:hypothetical protein
VAQDLPAPITVFRRSSTTDPAAFLWRKRRWRIDRVLQRWSIDTGWWRDELYVNRRYLRVVAQGRIFDLFYDRRQRRWFLERAL